MKRVFLAALLALLGTPLIPAPAGELQLTAPATYDQGIVIDGGVRLRQRLVGARPAPGPAFEGVLPGVDAFVESSPRHVEEYLRIAPGGPTRFVYEFTLESPGYRFRGGDRLEVLDPRGLPHLRMTPVVYWVDGKERRAKTELAAEPTVARLTIDVPREDSEILLDPGWSIVTATFFGGAGNQRGTGVRVSGGFLYFCGVGGAADDEGLIGRYATPPSNPPNWSATWPGVAGGDQLNGLDVDTTTGLYVAGTSYSQTTDTVGGKENKGITLRYPQGGSSPTWQTQSPAAPGAFGYGGYEQLNNLSRLVEGGGTFVYVAGNGQINGANGGRFFLTKLDLAGAVQWTVTDGGEMVGNSYSSGIDLAPEGSLFMYVVGRDDDTGPVRPSIRKYSTAGALQWAQNPTDMTGQYQGVAVFGGEIYAVGRTAFDGTSNFLIEKWDGAGTKLWSKTYDRGGLEDALFGVVGLGGRIYATGLTVSGGSGGTDCVVLELDPATGDLLDTQLYGGANNDSGRDIATDGTDLYVVGESRSFTVGGNGAGENDVMILRITVPAGPNAPTNLTASDLGNPKPKFSARHADLQGQAANKRRIQIGPTAADVTAETNLLWNEAAAGVAIAPSVADLAQSGTYDYGGSTLNWNTTYFWRMKFWDTANNEGDWSNVASYATATPSTVLPNPSGWQMVSAPSGTSVASTAMGGGTYWWWNEATRNYEEATTLVSGRGYFWAGSGAMSLTGGSAIDAPVAIGGLTSNNFGGPMGIEASEDQWAGWHMMGNPYNGTISWDTIFDGGFTSSVDATYTRWDGTQYLTYNAATNSGPAGPSIPKFQAFWIHVSPLGATGSVTLQPPTLFGEPGVPTPFDANWWLLQVSASSGALLDDCNWAGVHALGTDGWDVRDGAEPGTLSNPFIRCYFEYPEWPYHQDVRATPFGAGDVLTWALTVEVSVAPMNVTLSFPNLAQMPGEWTYAIDGIPLADFAYVQNVLKQTFTLTATRQAAGTGTLEVKLGPNTPGPREYADGESMPVVQLELTAAAENILVNPIPVSPEGTASVGGVRVYHDINGDGRLDPSEPQIGSVLVPAGTSTWVLVFFERVAGGWVRAILDPGMVTGAGQATGTAVTGNGVFVEGATMSQPARVAPGGGGGGGGCVLGAPNGRADFVLFLSVLVLLAGVRRRASV